MNACVGGLNNNNINKIGKLMINEFGKLSKKKEEEEMQCNEMK